VILAFPSCSSKESIRILKTSKAADKGTSLKPILKEKPVINEKAPIIYPKADTFYVEEIIKNYEALIIEAINNNDFSQVENLLIPNSKLYNAQKKLIKDLYAKNIKEKLVEYSIVKIENTSKKDEYKVYVIERIGIQYAKKDYKEKEFKWIYTVVQGNEKIGISDIEEWR
jgi:hypothetical protein